MSYSGRTSCTSGTTTGEDMDIGTGARLRGRASRSAVPAARSRGKTTLRWTTSSRSISSHKDAARRATTARCTGRGCWRRGVMQSRAGLATEAPERGGRQSTWTPSRGPIFPVVLIFTAWTRRPTSISTAAPRLLDTKDWSSILDTNTARSPRTVVQPHRQEVATVFS